MKKIFYLLPLFLFFANSYSQYRPMIEKDTLTIVKTRSSARIDSARVADSLAAHNTRIISNAAATVTNANAISNEVTNRITAVGAKQDTANSTTYFATSDFYGAGTSASALKVKGKADSAATAIALALKAPSGVDSIRVLTSNPTTGNVYISSVDNRLHYKSGTNWYRLTVQDSATTVVGPTLITLTPSSASSGFTESPTGVWGTGTDDAVWNKTIASGQDGWIQSDINPLSTALYSVIGMDSETSLESYGTFKFGAWVDGSNLFSWVDNNTVTHGTIAAVAGDKIRLRRVGTTVTSDYSRDGGTTWTTYHTMTQTSTGIAYLKASIAVGGNHIYNPKGANVQ